MQYECEAHGEDETCLLPSSEKGKDWKTNGFLTGNFFSKYKRNEKKKLKVA